jgi:hypothetical protein
VKGAVLVPPGPPGCRYGDGRRATIPPIPRPGRHVGHAAIPVIFIIALCLLKNSTKCGLRSISPWLRIVIICLPSPTGAVSCVSSLWMIAKPYTGWCGRY